MGYNHTPSNGLNPSHGENLPSHPSLISFMISINLCGTVQSSLLFPFSLMWVQSLDWNLTLNHPHFHILINGLMYSNSREAAPYNGV